MFVYAFRTVRAPLMVETVGYFGEQVPIINEDSIQ